MPGNVDLQGANAGYIRSSSLLSSERASHPDRNALFEHINAMAVDRRLADPEQRCDLVVGHPANIERPDHPLSKVHRVRPLPHRHLPRASRSNLRDHVDWLAL